MIVEENYGWAKKRASKKIMENYDVDRFSDLPESIIHHIMSFLPTTDSTRVSILSKRLASVCHSYPILDFDQPLYDQVLSHSKAPPVLFLDFMQKSVERLESNISLEKYKLRIKDHSSILDKRIEESICFAIDRNVKELVLNFGGLQRRHGYKYYSLPKLITSNSIVVLNLSGFDFNLEDLIPNLTLVEDFTISNCCVSSNFTISSAKLKSLKLTKCRGLKNIVIDAFNLQSFETTTSCEINLVHCKSLKSITLCNATITDDWIGNNIFLKEIKIYNQQLKRFELLWCDKLVKADIEAPNLDSFDYKGFPFPEITLLCSGRTHANLYLSTNFLTTQWFENLRNFLVFFGHCKILSLISEDMELIFPKELRKSLVPPLLDLKHLQVESKSLSTGHPSIALPELLDSLLCLSPYLETMFITLKYKEKSSTFQNKTTEAEEEDPDIQWPCSWRHYLRKVIIIIDKFEGNDVKETVVNFFLENEILVETISKV
ncbi:f-box/lrr-repeat protein 15 [Fagus crenata]